MMDWMAFWKTAVKIVGIGAVAFFVLWQLFGDIIKKITSFSSEQGFILAGMIIVFVSLLTSMAIVKGSHKDEDRQG